MMNFHNRSDQRLAPPLLGVSGAFSKAQHGFHFVMGWCLLIVFSFGCKRQSSPNVQGHQESVSFVSLAAADSKTPDVLMENLNAASLGMDFVHEWKPRNRYEKLLLKTGFTGGGVCMGDYDGDGNTDVLLTRPHGGLRLYRNLGGFRFENATETAGVSCEDVWTTGAAMVDLNGDGHLELIVCAYDGPNLVFLNQGDGKFQEIGADVGLNFNGASVKIVWADYDNDGDLDGYLTTNRLEPKSQVNVRYLGGPGNYSVAPEHLEQVGVLTLPSGEQKFFKAGQADHLFKNQLMETGELRFTDVTEEAQLVGYYHGLDVTWWDANGDNLPDLYVANDFTDPDQFFINQGDGTFRDATLDALPSTPWFTMGAAFGDLNRDGRLDLLATDMAGTSHYRQKMAMGSMDTLAWFLDNAEPRQHMRNALFLNTGTDRFIEVAQSAGLSNSDWTWSVKLADLDNDGYEDAFMTNGFTRDYLDSDFNLRLKQSGKNHSLAWYDAPILNEKNIAFRNQASSNDRLDFERVSKEWGVDFKGISFGAAYGDLDNDGDLDLVVNNFGGPPSVYRNRSPQRFHRIKIALQGSASNSQGYGTLVRVGDQTRWFNPHNGFMSSNDPFVYFGLGDQQVIPEITVRWPSGTVQRFTNVAADQLITITETASDNDRPNDGSVPPNESEPSLFEANDSVFASVRHSERPFDDFAQQPLLPNKLSQLGPGMAWGDANGDGFDDVYFGGAAGQAGQLLLADSHGKFHHAAVEAFAADAESEDMGCLFLDIDADGDLDLYVVSGGVEFAARDARLRDRLYINTGVGADRAPKWMRHVDLLPDLRDSGGPVAAADFDRDGDLDLFVGGRVLPGQYPLSSPSRLLVNQQGRFLDTSEELCPDLLNAGMVTSAIWCDVDSDGWCDLVLATEYGPIRIYANRHGVFEEKTEHAGLQHQLGWWNGLAATDVDSDGDIDLVATNFGNNTKYHPSKEHPQMIFFADFDGSGKTRIVEAKSTEAALLPVRGRSCSSNAMPVLRDRFKTYHSFASATLRDIYSQAHLDNALQRSATTLKSSLLINDGQGRFELEYLPELAQVAPAFGVQFLETGGPSPSLFVAQNFYHAQRETGRMNGGVGILMSGNSNRTTQRFSALWPHQSGIVIHEDARSVAAIDVNGDGRQDLVVAVNDGPPRFYLQSSQTQRPFVVDLIGTAGNEAAIGAQIVAIDKNGTPSARVVTAGEGYLTQRPATVFLGQKPAKIMVQWPDGEKTERDISAATQSSLELRHPALRAE